MGTTDYTDLEYIMLPGPFTQKVRLPELGLELTANGLGIAENDMALFRANGPIYESPGQRPGSNGRGGIRSPERAVRLRPPTFGPALSGLDVSYAILVPGRCPGLPLGGPSALKNVPNHFPPESGTVKVNFLTAISNSFSIISIISGNCRPANRFHFPI